jgi:hypothetical protein
MSPRITGVGMKAAGDPGQGTTVAFARVRDNRRERLRLGCVEAVVGPANFHERVTDGVRAWQQQEAPDGASSGTS